MAGFSGAPQGYLDFDERQASRRKDAVNAEHLRAIMGQMLWKQQLESHQNQQKEQSMEDAGGALGPMFRGMPPPLGAMPGMGAPGGGQLPMPPGMAQGPQPPAPGQPSVPSGPPGGMPAPPQAGPPPQHMTAPNAQDARARMEAMDRAGIQGSVTGQMPGGRPVEPYRGLPAPPAGAGSPGEPPGAPGQIPPPPDAPRETQPFAAGRPPKDEPLTPTLASAVQALTAQGLTGARLMRALEQIAPRLDAMAQQQIRALNATLSAQRAETARLESDRRDERGRSTREQGDRRLDEQARVNDARIEGIRARIEQGAARAAQSGAVLDDSTAQLMAEQVVAGDRSVFTNLGRGAQGAENVIKVRRMVEQLARERGLGGSQLANITAEFEGLKAGQRALGTRTAQFGMAKEEAYEMADLVTQASANASRTQFMPINRALNAFNTNTGDTAIREFGAAINSFINAYARAISPVGTPTVSDKEHAREMLSTADSHEQVNAIIGQLKKEMEAAGKAPGAVRETFRKGYTGGQAPAGAPVPASSVTGGGTPAAPAAGERKSIGGKSYVKRNGQWFQE